MARPTGCLAGNLMSHPPGTPRIDRAALSPRYEHQEIRDEHDRIEREREQRATHRQ